jgi:hypothetical protein
VSITAAALLLAACPLQPGRFSAGHPLDSTKVLEWGRLSATSIHVTLEFRDDAPSYGCLLEAFTEDDRSIGYLRARPRGQNVRVMRMELDRGTSDEVERVSVTDCDI